MQAWRRRARPLTHTTELICDRLQMFASMVATQLKQSHVCPLPLSAQPVMWDYDFALRLYPAPDAFVMADRTDAAHTLFGDPSAFPLRIVIFVLEFPPLTCVRVIGACLRRRAPLLCCCLAAIWWSSFSFADEMTQCMNPGSFGASGTFVCYLPNTGEVEVSQVGVDE